MAEARPGVAERSTPSRLSALDEAIRHLDSPAEPWSIQLEVRVGGIVDDSRLRAAVGAAVRHHGRVRARMTAGRGRRAYWEPAHELDLDALDVVTCVDDDELAAAREQLYQGAPALTASPPVRVRLAHHPDGDVVMFNLHHALADGLSGLSILRSVATAYAGQPLGPDEAAVPVEVPVSAGWAWARTLTRELRGAVARYTHVVPDGGDERGGYGFHHRSLTAEQTKAVVDRAKGGPTVNDVLVAALHRAVERWNNEHHLPSGRIGVLVPVNLRARSSWYEGMGNFSFLVPVATSPKERLSPSTTLDAVWARTRQIKERLSAAAVVKLLSRLSFLPSSLRHHLTRATARPEVMPTAILSNLGRLPDGLDFGPGVGSPVEMWFSPPTKMPLGVGVGAVTVHGRLHLTFRYRHPLFGPAQVARFADQYLDALADLVPALARRHPELAVV
jgi:NRPS condensation-like uncharacterized protein